jgi:hypothetical protein
MNFMNKSSILLSEFMEPAADATQSCSPPFGLPHDYEISHFIGDRKAGGSPVKSG